METAHKMCGSVKIVQTRDLRLWEMARGKEGICLLFDFVLGIGKTAQRKGKVQDV